MLQREQTHESNAPRPQGNGTLRKQASRQTLCTVLCATSQLAAPVISTSDDRQHQ